VAEVHADAHPVGIEGVRHLVVNHRLDHLVMRHEPSRQVRVADDAVGGRGRRVRPQTTRVPPDGLLAPRQAGQDREDCHGADAGAPRDSLWHPTRARSLHHRARRRPDEHQGTQDRQVTVPIGSDLRSSVDPGRDRCEEHEVPDPCDGSGRPRPA
jgi:hypothetical protein